MEEKTENTAVDLSINEGSLSHKTARLGMLMHRYYMLDAHANGRRDPMRGQGRLLTLLKATPVTTQRDLSFVLDMRQQSLSELLSKLEERGFVTREKSPEDGRVTVVRLTEAGAAAAEQVNGDTEKRDVFDCLSDDDRETFERIVDTVTFSIKQKLVELGEDPELLARHPHGHGRGHMGHPGMGCHGHHGYGRHGRGPHEHECEGEPRDMRDLRAEFEATRHNEVRGAMPM